MEHHFNIEIATKYGILEAIILNNFYFWINKNEANDRNYHDGHYWTYNSAKALHTLFPYASERKIRNALKHLEDEGMLITGNYNQSAYDRTMWYALTENAICILQNRQMEDAEASNGSAENARPIPDDRPNNKDIYADVPAEIKEVFMEWVAMRKQIKKPITSKQSVTRAINKLNQLSEDPQEQTKLIELAIDKCWLGFYPPKQENTVKSAHRPPEPPKYRTFEPEPEVEVSQMPEEMRNKYRGFINEL